MVRLFLSAVSKEAKESLRDRGIRFRELLSYYTLRKHKQCFDYLNQIAQEREEIMIDSGAFTAFNSKIPIELEPFLLWHERLQGECPAIKLKASLDAIGSEELSGFNHQKALDRGLDLFPTYHRGDSRDYLAWLLSLRPDGFLLGLGGIASEQGKVIDDWLAGVFHGLPGESVQTHLFGSSRVVRLKRHGFYSADSSTHSSAARRGWILVPQRGADQQLDYQKPLLWMMVGNSKGHATPGEALDCLKEGEKEVLLAYISQQGFAEQSLKLSHVEREVFNAIQTINQANALVPGEYRRESFL